MCVIGYISINDHICFYLTDIYAPDFSQIKKHYNHQPGTKADIYITLKRLMLISLRTEPNILDKSLLNECHNLKIP